MSGMVFQIKTDVSGKKVRVTLSIYTRLTRDRIDWINNQLPDEFSVEHVGHGRYEFVSPVERLPISLATTPVTLRNFIVS